MSDTTIAGLATTQEADGTELIPAVSGGAAKSISTKTLRAYSSSIWTAKTAGNVVGSLTGGVSLSTSMTLLGSSNAYQLVPFSITEEQRSSISDALLRINRLNNSTSTADTIYAAFYDAETGLLLSQAHNGLVFTPGSDGVLTLTIPNIGKYPSRFLVGLCSGVLGGAGADVFLQEAFINGAIGIPLGTNADFSVVIAAECAFMVAASWDTPPADLSSMQQDTGSVSQLPFTFVG